MKFYQLFISGAEIALIATAIYMLIRFFWNTRAMDLIVGAMAFLALFWLATWLKFPVLQKLMLYIVNVSVLALLIIFQPEVRLALSKLSFKGRAQQRLSEFDHFLEGLTTAIFRLSEKRVGALVVLENQDSLDEFAKKGVPLGAEFSPELLESLFMTTTPLHDGGVIIDNGQIKAAAVILPLADEGVISKSMGTRHRAGIGISQITDALVIVVSEETGKVSIAREGVMTRSIKPDRFKTVIRGVFVPEESLEKPETLSFFENLKERIWGFMRSDPTS